MILAIENSTLCGSVALISGSHCLCESSLLSRLSHSKRLLGTIEYIMDNCEVSWKDLDGIAVSLGPGSFTGLRIGLATAKGLAMAAELPLIGVAALDGLAAQLPHADQLICPLLDARKKEVYAALYQATPDGPKCISDYMAITPGKLTELIKEPTILVGDGATLYMDLLCDNLKDHAMFVPPHLVFAKASAIGFLAIKKWHSRSFLEIASSVPIYVRASDAEICFRKKAEGSRLKKKSTSYR